MGDVQLRVEKDSDGVGFIVLDRPATKNALTVAMRDGIIDAIRDFRADPEVRVLLVTGEGDAFCAGMDLSASTVAQAGKPGFSSRTTSEALRAGVQTFIRELWELDKPTVAAVNGAAVGPGAHLGLACDFVLVAPGSRFMWTFAKWGLVADAGGAYLLPRLVGLPRAKAMVMLGEGVPGEEAVDVRARLPVRRRRCHAVRRGARARGAPRSGTDAVARTLKRLLNATFETDLPRGLELEAYFQALATGSPDIVEGMAAFRDKREAKFTGT